MRSKYTKRRRQRGGNIYSNVIIILLIFVFLLKYMNIIGTKGIDNITTYGIDDMKTLEDIGIGLIPYDDTVARSMHSIIDDTKEAIDMPVSYELSLTDDMRIHDIQPWTSPEELDYIRSNPEKLLDYNFGTFEYTTGTHRGYYDSRQNVKDIRRNWIPSLKQEQSYIVENDINILLNTFMPKIISMSNSIPENIYFQGAKQIIDRSPFGPQLFHQDIDQLALIGPPVADNDYRIMYLERDDRYDKEWTHIAESINMEKANRYVKRSLGSYGIAELLDFDIDKTKYVALIFDNNKVFHRTPPTPFWDWLTNNIPGTRRVLQLRIAWDDYEQIDYDRSFEEIFNSY